MMRTRSHRFRALADARSSEGPSRSFWSAAERMPLVRRLVAEWFGCAEFEEEVAASGSAPTITNPKARPQHHANPDEAVALGATIQAGILSGAVQNVVLLDVTPLSLGIETFGGLMNVIIPRNSTIPIKAGEMFTNAVAGQHVDAHQRAAGRTRTREGQLAARRVRRSTSSPRRKARRAVGVQFEIDANGILHVLARDTKTGARENRAGEQRHRCSDEAVEKMLEESLEHAFERPGGAAFDRGPGPQGGRTDRRRRARPWPIARRNGIGCPERVETALDEVRQSLATENPESKTGDVQRLQAACAALDQVTKPLADLLMDKVSGGPVRKSAA